MFPKKGFTLVEMLIVIVIIGILAAALIPRLMGIQARARDTARKGDIRTIQTALELHHLDNGFYPQSNNPEGCSSYANVQNGWCNSVQKKADDRWIANGNLANYINKDPVDPRPVALTTANRNTINENGGVYYYASLNNADLGTCIRTQYYVILAGMEGSKNKNRGQGKNCSGGGYNPPSVGSYVLVHDNIKGTLAQ